jgi:RNA polymerase sigma-70 factor (ECF subfamily)
MSDRDRPRISEADLAAARRREPDAVNRIYIVYAPALVRFFRAAVADHHQAEDLAAATFVSAIEALPRFRGPVEAFGGWLFQIARHELYDHQRKEARSRMEPLEDKLSEAAAADGVLDPEELAVERLDSDRVMVAIRQLPPQQREVLLLRIAGGLTVSEVATILGKTPGAVRALNHRGLKSLARILGVRPSPSEPVAEATNNGREAAGAATEIAAADEAVHAPSAAAPSALQQVRSPEPKDDSDSPSTQVGRRRGTRLRLPVAAVLGGLSLLLVMFSGWSLTVAAWLV